MLYEINFSQLAAHILLPFTVSLFVLLQCGKKKVVTPPEAAPVVLNPGLEQKTQDEEVKSKKMEETAKEKESSKNSASKMSEKKLEKKSPSKKENVDEKKENGEANPEGGENKE